MATGAGLGLLALVVVAALATEEAVGLSTDPPPTAL